jgi:hypothetical protein
MRERRIAATTLVLVSTCGMLYAALSARGANATGAAAELLESVGMEGSGIPVPSELSSGEEESIFQYSWTVDVTELAAQWTTALLNSGYQKEEDLSQDETRYVFEYKRDDAKFVLVVAGASSGGPIVDMAAVEEYDQHWAVNTSVPVPAALGELW